jgi:hypothetical protein
MKSGQGSLNSCILLPKSLTASNGLVVCIGRVESEVVRITRIETKKVVGNARVMITMTMIAMTMIVMTMQRNVTARQRNVTARQRNSTARTTKREMRQSVAARQEFDSKAKKFNGEAKKLNGGGGKDEAGLTSVQTNGINRAVTKKGRSM